MLLVGETGTVDDLAGSHFENSDPVLKEEPVVEFVKLIGLYLLDIAVKGNIVDLVAAKYGQLWICVYALADCVVLIDNGLMGTSCS